MSRPLAGLDVKLTLRIADPRTWTIDWGWSSGPYSCGGGFEFGPVGLYFIFGHRKRDA